MYYTDLKELRIPKLGGAVGTIENVVFETGDNGIETDKVHHYEMNVDGKHGVIVYPDEIERD